VLAVEFNPEVSHWEGRGWASNPPYPYKHNYELYKGKRHRRESGAGETGSFDLKNQGFQTSWH
jgi:hypothetical protein